MLPKYSGKPEIANDKTHENLAIFYAVHRVGDSKPLLMRAQKAWGSQVQSFEVKTSDSSPWNTTADAPIKFKTQFQQMLTSIPDVEKTKIAVIFEWNLGMSGQNVSVYPQMKKIINETWSEICKEKKVAAEVKPVLLIISGNGAELKDGTKFWQDKFNLQMPEKDDLLHVSQANVCFEMLTKFCPPPPPVPRRKSFVEGKDSPSRQAIKLKASPPKEKRFLDDAGQGSSPKRQRTLFPPASQNQDGAAIGEQKKAPDSPKKSS